MDRILTKPVQIRPYDEDQGLTYHVLDNQNYPWLQPQKDSITKKKMTSKGNI